MKLNPAQQTAWTALFRAHTNARARADAALRQTNLPSLEVYDILLELDRSKTSNGMTAKQLQDQLLLPQYGVSRMIDQLEKQGLLVRQPHPDDRRSHLIQITPKGRDLREVMWKHYGPAIEQFFTNRLRPGQVERLASLLMPLATTTQNNNVEMG